MSTDATETAGPILFAYDGSDLAGHAITEAAQQLKDGRQAFVLTVGADIIALERRRRPRQL